MARKRKTKVCEKEFEGELVSCRVGAGQNRQDEGCGGGNTPWGTDRIPQEEEIAYTIAHGWET